MKRDDLQAIRGIAILLVLMFHLQPTVFPLGFVGVDMFFVLSGFLMAMILSKEKFSIFLIRDFYVRRFKRIVPLMYTIILFIYIGCMFLLTEMDKDDLKNDIVWSLSFTSNIQPLYEIKGYWDQISSYRFLVHCWSLGVEIQFYVFAPFIISFTNYLSPFQRKFTLLVFIATSLVFQLLASPKVSYGLLPSRIWQFLLGSLCFEPTTKEKNIEVEKEKLLEEGESDVDDEQEEEETKVIAASKSSFEGKMTESLMGFVCFIVIANWNTFFPVKAMRIFGTFSAAILIKWPETPSKSLITNRFLVYMGDISYVMYLIHWPIIVATKYFLDVECLDPQSSIFLFICVFLLSSLLHHTLEKFLTSSSLWIGFAISLISVSSIFLSFPYYHKCCSLQVFTNNKINITEAIAWNTYESKKVYYHLPCEPDKTTPNWTNYREESQLRCETKGNGTLKVLVIGNSMAYRAFPLIEKVLKGRYSELRLYSRSSRPPLSNVSPEFTNATHIVVDRMRPDILWNVHVDERPEFLSPFVNKTDPVYLAFKENMDYYKARSKVFVIDLPFYWSSIRVAYEIAKRLHIGRSIEDFKVPKSEAIKQQKEHRKRLKAVECDNCVYNDVEKQMYNGDTLYLYNPKNYHAYTGDGHHFTPEMLERLTPLYQKTVDEAIKRLQNK